MNWETLCEWAEEELERAGRKLPETLQDRLAEVAVAFEEIPDEGLQRDGFPADLLGLFSGECLADRGQTMEPAPPQIHLYLQNLWDYAEQREKGFREEVRITYLHELGHYLGWDEEDLAKRGLE
ncbi:MAG: metallopeptidase family protein [Opitutales bacterium]|nr:metallopeptidase family protein [Opitutales bacterium]MCH8539994.1 metallopeptidase family protein [Opitutales bacterium]